MRIGSGYDVHKLVEGRKLILGGVQIDFDKGLLGHSDADVLTHAIMDALLGAAGMGDIGKHFPDNDDNYKDISSMKLLYQVLYLLKKQNYSIINIDATIIAKKPKRGNTYSNIKEQKILSETAQDLGFLENNSLHIENLSKIREKGRISRKFEVHLDTF